MGNRASKPTPVPVAIVEPTYVRDALRLPSKVLEHVLDYLALDRKALLGYRLVNHEWKSAINSILEKKVLSTVWLPFPQMSVMTRSLNGRTVVQCPPAIDMELEPSINPFPSSSLVLVGNSSKKQIPIKRKLSYVEDDDDEETAPSDEETLCDFLPKFGTCVTSLTLHDLPICLVTLVGVLDRMKNLKMVRLCDVTITDLLTKMFQKLPVLPQLPQLTTLLFQFDKFEQKSVNDRKKVRIVLAWLVAFYAVQLERLEVEGGVQLPSLKQGISDSRPKFFMDSHVIATLFLDAFGEVKVLKIFRPCRTFLQQGFPTLERLSISGLDLNEHVDFLDVAEFVENCGDTLKHLYLDIEWEELLDRNYYPKGPDGKELGSKFKLESVRKEAVACRGKLYVFRNKLATKLNTLSIQVPKDEVEAAVIRGSLILKFPRLETVKLLHFVRVAGANAVIQEGIGKEQQVKGFVRNQNYWGICHNLKVIKVCSGKGPDGDVYVEYRK